MGLKKFRQEMISLEKRCLRYKGGNQREEGKEIYLNSSLQTFLCICSGWISGTAAYQLRVYASSRSITEGKQQNQLDYSGCWLRVIEGLEIEQLFGTTYGQCQAGLNFPVDLPLWSLVGQQDETKKVKPFLYGHSLLQRW